MAWTSPEDGRLWGSSSQWVVWHADWTDPCQEIPARWCTYLLQTRPGLLRMFLLFQVPFAVRELLKQLIISGSLSKDVFEQRTSTASEVFFIKTPRRYKICITKFLYCYGDDLLEYLGKTTAHEWKKSTSGWCTSLKPFLLKLTKTCTMTAAKTSPSPSSLLQLAIVI